MKVRWLLVVPILMAVFAVAPLGASAAPSALTEEKIGLTSTGQYPFVHGVADYKTYAGGGSSLGVSVQGAQALRFQKLYVFILPGLAAAQPGQPCALHSDGTPSCGYIEVCTLHIGAHGNGGCYIDTRLGEIVPTITSGTYIDVRTSNDTLSSTNEIAYGFF